MVLAQPLLLLPALFSSTLAWLLIGAAFACLLSYGLIYGIRVVSLKAGWIRPAEPGRTQDKVPRLGGLGIYLAFVIASLLFYAKNPALRFTTQEMPVYWLFLAAATLIVLVHAYDDVKPLKPLLKLFVQTVAVIILMGPFVVGKGSGWKFYGVLLFGFSNPFQASAVEKVGLPWYQEPIVTLIIHNTNISFLAIPAILFTWFWMVGMMNTVNLIDGVDGLAGGVVTITGICITLISWRQGQYTIATLAAIFTGATLGFLPHNWNPARIFMGDSGSQFLGLGLAALSIMGGAKLALALMVLGLPILDVAVVVINRLRRGQHPLHYDTTHLHHRLRATGLSPRQICYVFYGFTTLFGILALNLFLIYKLIGIGLVVLTMIGLIVWIDYRQRQRGTPIDLGGEPDNDSGAGDQAMKLSPTESDEDYALSTAVVPPVSPPQPDSTAVRSDTRVFL